MQNGTRVLLTGGAGFIGSHLGQALLAAGARLTVVDNLNDFYAPAWKHANLADLRRCGDLEFYPVDICNLEALRGVFSQAEPQVVIHLAAYAGVRPSIQRPRLYEQVNVAGTVNILELCREFRTAKLLFGSSSSVYGATSRAPFSEDQVELRPISPYAATKLAGEMLAYTYAHLYGLATVCLRFFTVYGPCQRPDLAIHKFTALIEAGLPVPVFGDGTTGRDYTYVDDIVAGVMAAADFVPRGNAGVPFEIFNLGNSHPVTLSELLDLLEQVTGRRVIRQTQPLQPGDVPLTWADISRSSSLLGYRPATPLEEGLKKFVQWYRSADPGRRLTPKSSQIAHAST